MELNSPASSEADAGRYRIPIDDNPSFLREAFARLDVASSCPTGHLPMDIVSASTIVSSMESLELCPGHMVEIADEKAGATSPIVSVHLKNERSRQWLLYLKSNTLNPMSHTVSVWSSHGEEIGVPQHVSQMKNKRWKVNITNLKDEINAQDRAQYSLFRLVITPKTAAGCNDCHSPRISRIILFYRARLSPSANATKITTTNTASSAATFFMVAWPGENSHTNFTQVLPPLPPPPPPPPPPVTPVDRNSAQMKPGEQKKLVSVAAQEEKADQQQQRQAGDAPTTVQQPTQTVSLSSSLSAAASVAASAPPQLLSPPPPPPQAAAAAAAKRLAASAVQSPSSQSGTGTTLPPLKAKRQKVVETKASSEPARQRGNRGFRDPRTGQKPRASLRPTHFAVQRAPAMHAQVANVPPVLIRPPQHHFVQPQQQPQQQQLFPIVQYRQQQQPPPQQQGYFYPPHNYNPK